MIWMSYPKGQARTIKYELTAVLAKTGDYLLAGDFLIESKQGSAVHLPFLLHHFITTIQTTSWLVFQNSKKN